MPDDVPFDLVDSVPELESQIWAKVVSFAPGGYEVYCSRHTRALIKPRNVITFPLEMCISRKRKTRDEQDSECVRRSMQRAKQRVRWRCKNMGASHLLTLTSREAGPVFMTYDQWLAAWDRFKRLVERATGGRFPYVWVVEPHPSNPLHLHMHVALAARANLSLFRRCWYIALGGRGNERGAVTPGGVDVQAIKSPNKLRRTERIARYISKYITKDSAAEFNRKRYGASQMTAPEVRSFWMRSATITDALGELIETLGLQVVSVRSDLFIPSGGDFMWVQHVPELSGAGPPCPF